MGDFNPVALHGSEPEDERDEIMKDCLLTAQDDSVASVICSLSAEMCNKRKRQAARRYLVFLT
jgi:hypothetical protein